MKKSEKLFMLINDIDESIISEAKDEPQKASKISVEKRGFPIRETLSFAACFAVLAVGIFAVMRFRFNAEPVDSNPKTSGTQISNGSNVQTELSEDDAKLREILSALEPGYDIFDWFFNGISGTDGQVFLFGENDPYGETYYPLTDGFPQSYSDMETLIYKYFTDRSAGVFMKYVCRADKIIQNPDGSFTVSVEDKGRVENNKNPIFIEADGKMYGTYMGRGSTGKPIVNTAKVTSKTGSAISFTCQSAAPDGEPYDAEGTVMFEHGGWRLNCEMPWLERYSDADREFQATLRDLVSMAEEIDGMFTNMSAVGDKYTFKFGEHYQSGFYRVQDGRRTANGLFDVPQSYDETEQLILRYFSRESAKSYMSRVGRSTMTQNADGTYNVKVDSDAENCVFLEINGDMYYKEQSGEYLGMGIDCETAKVTRKTDKVTEFSYMGYDYKKVSDRYSALKGVIANEDGGLKLHFYSYGGFIPEMPTEYTEEDSKLQKILAVLERGDLLRHMMSMQSLDTKGEIYKFILPRNSESGGYAMYAEVTNDTSETGFPSSIKELEQELLKYFTQETTQKFMDNVCTGSITKNPDGSCNVTLGKDIPYPVFIEADGRMFYRQSAASGWDYLYNTAKVVEQTDDTIVYSIVYSETDNCVSRSETLKYERGGWKFDLFHSAE